MAKRRLPYKIPKVIRNKSGDWYIQYYYQSPEQPGKWVPFKERRGINYIKDPVEKEAAAELLRKIIERWLRLGNSPFDEVKTVDEAITGKLYEVEELKLAGKGWSLLDAIEAFKKFMNAMGYSANTLRSYNRYLRALEAWVFDNGYAKKRAADFTEIELEAFLNDEFEKENWSGRTFNNYLDFYRTFFARIEKLERKINRKIRYDIQIDDIDEKITKAQRNKAFTPLLEKLIKKELEASKFANLRDYCEWIHASLMRPDEIRHLKVKDIDTDIRQIRIIGKTGDRIIPITDELLHLIKKRKLPDEPECFVFGYAGSVTSKRMSVAYFLEQFAAIKKKLNLDANYGPYSFKPTAIIKMIRAGFKDEEIRVLSGHKTQAAFEAYKRDLVIDNSHVMKGKTIDF